MSLRALALAWLTALLIVPAAAPEARGLLRAPPAVGLDLPIDLPTELRDARGLAANPRRLLQARQLRIARALRAHPRQLDTDFAGELVRRAEAVALDPSPQALERARAAGFAIIDDRELEGLGLRLVRLRSPAGVGTRSALRQLRRLDPAGSYDFNHLYDGSGSGVRKTAATVSPGPERAAPVVRNDLSSAWRVGLVDSGVAVGQGRLANIDLRTWGCDGRQLASEHGTAVASLLLGDGANKGVTLYAADIYCGRPAGGAASELAAALAWMAREGVPVINLSLVGPPSQLLERVTQALDRRGHVLVAAVGNDGPAAPPRYPAAYPAVIAVTAVDPHRSVLPEAGRGTHVDFAAVGSQLRAMRPLGGVASVRGTSFAAPRVARAAAMLAAAPSPGLSSRIHAQLSRRTLDLGRRGRDEVYGEGLLADAGRPAGPGLATEPTRARTPVE